MSDFAMPLLLNLTLFLMFAVFVWFILRANRSFRKTAQMDAGPQLLENLIPLMAYDSDETGYWSRVPWISGLFCGVLLAAFPLVVPIPGLRYSAMTTAAIALFLGGPLFGFFLSAKWRSDWRRILAGLYLGERWIIDPPTPEQLFYYQIPCIWTDGKAGVGGVLYLGRGGFLFVSHKRNRNPKRLAMTPIKDVSIARAKPTPLNAIQRLFTPRAQEEIEIRWNGSSARFLVPDPAATHVKLSRCLEKLQRIPQQASDHYAEAQD